jgi:hypothetical protein
MKYQLLFNYVSIVALYSMLNLNVLLSGAYENLVEKNMEKKKSK